MNHDEHDPNSDLMNRDGAADGTAAPSRQDHDTSMSSTRSSQGESHDRHAGHSVAMFRDKFWLSLALTVPVVLLSRDIRDWFGYTVPTFLASEYLPAIIGTVVFLYGGLVFIRGAQGELRDRRPGMMTLISLAF